MKPMIIRVVALGLLLLCNSSFAAAYYADADIARIRERAKDPAFAKELRSLRSKADEIADKSDEQIWAMMTDAELPRAINVRFGTDCPVHGKEIFKHGGHYPWRMSSDKPFKIECPVGGETYPTNDFAAYLAAGRKETLDTKQKYIDDGFGWIDERGTRYFFVAYYNFWKLWRQTIVDGTEACAKMYIATGDKRYAHKAAVAMARISQIYPRMDWSKQGVSDGKWPSGWTGRINDRIWETAVVAMLARAYDAIRPTLDEDTALRELIQGHGIDDVQAAIERNILQLNAADIMEHRVHGNRMELGALATLALVLGNDDPSRGATTKQMTDWLLHGPGEMEFTFHNGFDRDGIGGESSPGYSAYWNDRFIETAEILQQLGIDVTKDHKWLRVAKGPGELRVLDKFVPRIGDTGGSLRGDRLPFNTDLLRFGVEKSSDADCARWLLEAPPRPADGTRAATQANPLSGEQLFKKPLPPIEHLQDLAKNSTYPKAPYTRNLGGYGLAVLELQDGQTQHAAWMYYGGPEAAHQHRDRLTLSYYAYDREVLSEMGYPSHWGPTASFWIQNTPSHYCVMVDQQAHPTRMAGHLTQFADSDGLKLASADGTAAWLPPLPRNAINHEEKNFQPDPRPTPPSVRKYQRTLALLDTGEMSVLLVDAFLVQGGKVHDYSFHGLPWGKLSSNLQLVRAQNKGTLMGEQIEYAADIDDERKYSGYQYMTRPRWYAPADVAHLSWSGDGELRQDSWFPNFSLREVILVDTVPPIRGGNPETIPYVLLRNTGDELTSLFVGITEIGKGATGVKSVTRVPASSPAAGAVVVTMASGDAWRIYLNESAGEVRFEDAAVSSLPFAAVKMRQGKAATVQLVGAGSFTSSSSNTATLRLEPIETIVQSVDYAAGAVQVDRPIDAPSGKQSVTVCAITGQNSQSYTVRSINGTKLGFGEVGLLTGRFEGGWDAAQQKLISRQRTAGYYNQFLGKSFLGMTAVSEDLKTTATITGYDRANNSFTLEADAATAARFTDANGDGKSCFFISDIAPGTKLVATPARTLAEP